jgi:5-methylcytosine-specific restriction endonuclease McrA
MKCKKCSKKLIGQQISYCSQLCSKLHLKQLYKKRNKEKVNAYNREWRRKRKYKILMHRFSNGNTVKKFRTKYLLNGNLNPNYILDEKCKICGTTKDLTLNHIVPRMCGGKDKPENLETMCMKCNNAEFRKLVEKALIFYFQYHKI